MELSEAQAQKLKNIDIVKATHEAREESDKLLNDQGFAVFALLISNFIAKLAEYPEKAMKEFAS